MTTVNPCFAPWDKRGQDNVCARCGSLDPMELLAWLQQVDGIHHAIEMAYGAHKVYITRPGVRNCDDGAIKFYLHHLHGLDESVKNELMDKLLAALKLSNTCRDMLYSNAPKAKA